MGTIWTRDNGGALTGTERIGADKANSGNSADSVHYTTEQLADFGESQNAAVPRPADANTLLILDAIADVANSAANTATIANAAADNAQAAADDAQTTADTAAAAAVAAQDAVDAITPASIGAATVAEAGNALTAAQNAQTTADNAASAATAAQGTADNAVSAAGVAQATADGAQTTANAALPKPGGTTTANGIVTGAGTAGSAVAVSTTTIADLVKRLGNVFTLNASTVLDDSYSGGIIFVDTSGGARTLTIPPTVGSGWNAIIVREGANALNVVGSTVGADTMLMAGPAAAANAVAIAVDNGGVSVIRRSAVKCWCAGVIA